MPCCTYLADTDVQYWHDRLDDPELRELLVEVNRIPGERWAIEPRQYMTQRRWLGRGENRTLYSLYSWVIGLEWQVINFAGGESSINHVVESAMVQTYLLGYLAGRAAAGKAVA